MSVHWRTQGIIVKKQDRGESDAVLTVFTKEFGKLKIWAASLRKITSKLRSGLEVPYLSDLAFIQGRSKKTVVDALPVQTYQGVRQDLSKLKVALRMLQTLDFFVRGEIRDEKAWALLKECLGVLNERVARKENCSRVYYYFFWNLVSILGWEPSHAKLDTRAQKPIELLRTMPLGRIIALQEQEFPVSVLHETTKAYFSRVVKEVQ